MVMGGSPASCMGTGGAPPAAGHLLRLGLPPGVVSMEVLQARLEEFETMMVDDRVAVAAGGRFASTAPGSPRPPLSACPALPS